MAFTSPSRTYNHCPKSHQIPHPGAEPRRPATALWVTVMAYAHAAQGCVRRARRRPSATRPTLASSMVEVDDEEKGDVWDSDKDMNAFMQVAMQVIDDADTKLAGPPEAAQLLNVVCPERWAAGHAGPGEGAAVAGNPCRGLALGSRRGPD